MTSFRNPKEVIQLAKQYIFEIFGDEGAKNIGLEEIIFDADEGQWEVTIGFSRAWDQPTFQNALAPVSGKRTYKIVDIEDASGEIIGVRNWPPGAAVLS